MRNAGVVSVVAAILAMVVERADREGSLLLSSSSEVYGWDSARQA
jgi:hypothetical protein